MPEQIGNVIVAHHSQFVTLTDPEDSQTVVCIHVDDIQKVTNKLLEIRKELLK